MDAAAVGISIGALVLSVLSAAISLNLTRRANLLSRQSNTLPVLVDLFREHRSDRLIDARRFLSDGLSGYDADKGFDAFADHEQDLVRALVWFYANLGALVAHGIVDVEPVSGFLGGSVLRAWTHLEPFIYAERKRRVSEDPHWRLEYFENLVRLVEETPPDVARARQPAWRL